MMNDVSGRLPSAPDYSAEPEPVPVSALRASIPSADGLTVFGDWRDLRFAIERAQPGWQQMEESRRNEMWDFASRLLAEYAPLKFQCWGCEQVLPIGSSYRCADCNAPYCGSCIHPHFGPNHRRHA